MIKLINVNKSIKDGNKNLQILKDINLTVSEGDLISVVGKSGSGKTTLLTILSMLDDDYSGQYIFYGNEINKLSEKEIFNLRSGYIANVFQSFNLINELSVIENVELPLGFKGVKKKIRRDIALKYLDWVGLREKSERKVFYLSGGEQQRVAIARALSMESKILLLDEPTGNLDKNTSEEIINLILSANNDFNKTCLIVTHDSDIANKCKRNLEISSGVLNEV